MLSMGGQLMVTRTSATAVPLVLGLFGASCVLLFGYLERPFSQPRNVVGGHATAAASGLVFLHARGPAWWSMALALACAFALMHATRTVHPPAGSNPVIVMLAMPDWMLLLTPTLAGSLLIVLTAVIVNNHDRQISHPRRWR